ncbi:MAG: PfkB family carbohydrate kinase [Trueperaceae bacterium]
MPELVTSGWLTIDDVVLPDGSYTQKVLGGGALYSAVGAAIWNEDVGVHSVTGKKYLAAAKREIGRAGLDAAGLNGIVGNGLELWLLHESESEKQQVPKLTSSTADEMDQGRAELPEPYLRARGFHIAPQTPDGSFPTLKVLAAIANRPVITLDILVDPYVDVSRYADLGFLEKVTAFLPSREEVARLWRPASLTEWLRTNTDRHGRILAIKMGSEGSLVCAGKDAPIHRVPALPVSARDTTGAGDAFCGGFLAGLVEHRPVPECAAMATVSASYVVEARGALATVFPDPKERGERLKQVLKRISIHG